MPAMSDTHAMASQAWLESYQFLWLRFFIMVLLFGFSLIFLDIIIKNELRLGFYSARFKSEIH